RARYRAVWMSVRPVERDWEWEFSASPAALWPVLADTARFNEAAGLPRYTVTDVPQPDGSVLRVGAARRFGLAFSWEEGVPQWIAGKSFAHERRFRFGPFRRVVTEIDIHRANGGGGSRVRYRLSIEPRGPLWAILLRCGFLARIGRMIDRLFRQAAEFAAASRGAKVSVTRLDQLPQGAHCRSCNIDYARDFSRNVEVTFEPDPSIRALGAGTYCLASPLASEHILVQRQLAPGEASTLAVELA